MEIQFDPSHPRMYSDLAWLWPVISPPEKYIAEALQVTDLIRPYKLTRATLHDPPRRARLSCTWAAAAATWTIS